MTEVIRRRVPGAYRALYQPKRRKVFYGGRGGAKSWQFAEAIILQMTQQHHRVLCTREFQTSIRESVHRLLRDTIERLGVGALFRVEQSAIYGPHDGMILFEGLRNNATKIKSMERITICWCEEAEAISEDSWRTLIPTIREKGSEIWVSYNPRDEDDATPQRFQMPYEEHLLADKVYEDDSIYVRWVSWRDNPYFPPELKAEMERDKALDYDTYLHVWEGHFRASVEGAVYSEQMAKVVQEGRICNVPIETGVAVNTFWDLGRNDFMSIWFHQKVGLENRFIGYYQNRLTGLDHYAKKLSELRDEWGITYGEHYLPHDVEVVSLDTNQSRRTLLEDLGVRPIITVSRCENLNAAIEVTRQKFASCWFDKTRCAEGIRALRHYQWTWDDKHQTFRRTPLHNWASNGADAFRQFATGYSGPQKWEPLNIKTPWVA